MARKKKRATLWDVLLRYLSGLVYFLSCFNPLHYLPQSFTDAINGQWSEALLALFQTETSRKRQLLRWVQEKVPDKHPRDWTGSWSDGTLLCALVEALGLNNARLGLKLAERNLGVPQLIAPEEISDSRLQSSDRLARYVSRLRQVSMRLESTNSQSKRVLSPQVSLEDTVVRDICTVSGSGLTVAEVNREATFNIFARSATIIDFEVQIKVPTGQVTSERVRQRAGLSVETFNQIFLEHKRKQVTRTGQKGRPRPRRELDPDKVYLGFVCTHEGFFQVGYTPKKAGFHLITVLWMGSPVEGCPFRVRVQDSSLEQNKMVLFKDQQEITTPKTVRRTGGPDREPLERVQVEVAKDDGRKRVVHESSVIGSEASAVSEDGGYVGGTYRRRIVKQPSGGSDSCSQEANERKKIMNRQGSGNQEQSDSDVSEGAFRIRNRVIRQDTGGSVDIPDLDTPETKRVGQRAARLERQNSASGIVTKRKVLNIIVMGEDISDASRRASIFKSSSSQGSLMSQQSGDKVEQTGDEARSGRWKNVSTSVDDKVEQGSSKEGVETQGKKIEAGGQKELDKAAIEAMSKKLSSDVIVDSFEELAVKVKMESSGNGRGDDTVKSRRRTLVKQSSLVPYLKEEGPYVIPSWVKNTPENSNTNIRVPENKRQKLVHQSSLIPYLKENGQPESCSPSENSAERSKRDNQRTGLPAQAPDETHVPRKPALASRHRVLTRQSSLVPYMKTASEEGLSASSEQSSVVRLLPVTPEISVYAESVPMQDIPHDGKAETANMQSTNTTSDDRRNTEKRPVPHPSRRLVKQSSLIPYMKLASVMSEATEESPESILESNTTTDSGFGSKDVENIKIPDAGSVRKDLASTDTENKTRDKEEDTQSTDGLLSLQEFLAMEPPNVVGLSSQKGEGTPLTEPQKPTLLRPILITDDTLMSLKEFLSLSTFEQMQAINLMQKRTNQTKTSEECTSLDTTAEGTTEETLFSLKEFLELRIQEGSLKEANKEKEATREYSDDALITLKEFLSLRDIAEQSQPTSVSKDITQTQQQAKTNIFNGQQGADNTLPNVGSGPTPPEPSELAVADSGWQDDIHSFQNPFVTNLLTTNRPQDECHHNQEDLLTSDTGSLGIFDERNKRSGSSTTELPPVNRPSGNVQVRQEEMAKERDLNVVHDLIDVGPDDNTLLPARAASDADTTGSSKAENQGQNGHSRRNGQTRAPLQRQSSLVPYLKQAEEGGNSSSFAKEPFGHQDIVCEAISEDAERSCIANRPSVSTLVKNWEEVTTRSADDTASGQHGMNHNAGNGSNFLTAGDGAVIGKASLSESPLTDLEAVMFNADRGDGETFSIVTDVQIQGQHGGHVDVLNTIMDQLNHLDSPVTGVMYDSDLENMDMDQDWIIIDTDPAVQPKDIIPAKADKEPGRRMTVRYRSEILVDIGEYDLERQREPLAAEEEAKVFADDVALNGDGVVRQKRDQHVKSASERKLSFMADDGNFPSLFVTTIDDPQGDEVQNATEEVSKLSSDVGGSEEVSCHWSVMSAEPTNRNSAIQFKPTGNSAAFLPPKAVQFQSISLQEREQPGMVYRNSLTLEVNQDPENSPQQPGGNLMLTEPRNGRRRRPIRDSFRRAVVDKEDESPDGSTYVLVSDCIERDALNSGFVDTFSVRPPARVDCSHKSLQVHSHQIRKETGYQDSTREDMRRRHGAMGGVSSIRNLLRSVDEKVSELSDIASEVMHNSSQHRNSLAEALRAAARKTSGELGPFDDDTARKTTRQSTDDSGISDVTIYVDGKGPYTWQERHNISSLEDRIPYWLLDDNESDSSYSTGGLRIPNESERASKSDSECVTRRPDRAGTHDVGPDCRRRSNASLPDTESMHDFTAQLTNDGTFANMRTALPRALPGESASLQASRQSWAGFPHTFSRRAVFSPGGDGYEAGDEPNEEDEGDAGTRKADGRSRSRVLAGRILAFGPGLDHGFVGAKNNFQVSTRNAGNGALNVSLVGPRKNTVAEVNVIYTGDDLYEVIYDVTQPGYYVLSVKWMDRNVPDSPFIVKIHEEWSVPNIPIPRCDSPLATNPKQHPATPSNQDKMAAAASGSHKDYEIVSPECGELRILRYNSGRHDSTSMIFGRQITAVKAEVNRGGQNKPVAGKPAALDFKNHILENFGLQYVTYGSKKTVAIASILVKTRRKCFHVSLLARGSNDDDAGAVPHTGTSFWTASRQSQHAGVTDHVGSRFPGLPFTIYGMQVSRTTQEHYARLSHEPLRGRGRVMAQPYMYDKISLEAGPGANFGLGPSSVPPVEGRIVSRWCRASSLDPFMPSTDAAHLRCQFMGLQLTAQKRRLTAEEALTDLSSCGPKRGPSVRYSPCIIIMATAGQQTAVKTPPLRFYQDRSYRHGFHGAVSDLQKSEVLQDVVLEVESRQIWRRGLDAAMLLSYIYLGTLHVSLDRVQHLYQVADLLQLDYVRDTCSRYMATNIEHSTCVDLYKFADAFAQCLVLICDPTYMVLSLVLKCDPILPPLLQYMVLSLVLKYDPILPPLLQYMVLSLVLKCDPTLPPLLQYMVLSLVLKYDPILPPLLQYMVLSLVLKYDPILPPLLQYMVLSLVLKCDPTLPSLLQYMVLSLVLKCDPILPPLLQYMVLSLVLKYDPILPPLLQYMVLSLVLKYDPILPPLLQYMVLSLVLKCDPTLPSLLQYMVLSLVLRYDPILPPLLQYMVLSLVLKCDPTLPPLLQYMVLSLVLKCDPILPPLLQYMVLSLVLKCDPTLPSLLQYMVLSLVLKCDPILPPLLQYMVLSLVLKCDPTLPSLLQYMVLSLVLRYDPILPPLLQYMVLSLVLKCDPTLPPLLQYMVLSLVLKCDPTLPPLLQYMVLSLVLKCDPTLPPLLQYMVLSLVLKCDPTLPPLLQYMLTEIISHDELDVKEETRVWETVQERDAVYEPQSRVVHQLWLPSRPSSCRDHDCYQDNIYILAGHSRA
ncbi:hypothetical protein Bbelb_213940 [Branchiostoma belcheri]|nr:hypothetical protein Bbelb_213940 [Branchiostoma belcheri]